jgi:hypothetical protein
MTPKSGAVNGTITGKLLSNETVERIPVLVFLLAVEENNNY